MAVQSTNIPPKEVVNYTKQTQTTSTGHERDGELNSGLDLPLLISNLFWNHYSNLPLNYFNEQDFHLQSPVVIVNFTVFFHFVTFELLHIQLFVICELIRYLHNTTHYTDIINQ